MRVAGWLAALQGQPAVHGRFSEIVLAAFEHVVTDFSTRAESGIPLLARVSSDVSYAVLVGIELTALREVHGSEQAGVNCCHPCHLCRQSLPATCLPAAVVAAAQHSQGGYDPDNLTPGHSCPPLLLMAVGHGVVPLERCLGKVPGLQALLLANPCPPLLAATARLRDSRALV